ncbi:hypothetical protein [Elizabethkingia argenteiflava]|nr:hypothetical protein [Elizabethkingia argenteiflava]
MNCSKCTTGFDNKKLDQALDLKSVLALPIGYRASEGDWLVNLKKLRQA